jgi:hypothetical protein
MPALGWNAVFDPKATYAIYATLARAGRRNRRECHMSKCAIALLPYR